MKLPTLEELLALRASARGLKLRARGAARALLMGNHRSARHGRGLEIEEVRPYVAGDDLRNVDWRVTARRGRLHTKLYREERERPVWLLVDLSATMFFGSRGQLKSMLAVRAAGLLAWAAALGGDRVGAVIGDGARSRVLALRSREAGVLPILRALIDLQPREPLGKMNPDPKEGLLRSLNALVRPGSVVIALSDFQSPDTQSQEQWSQLAAHSDCRWLWITDPLEEHALPKGRYLAGFDGRVAPVDGDSVRSAWLGAWALRAKRIAEIADALQIGLMRLDTGQNVVEALAATLHDEKRAA
jgi:uncharacterized protein (DUF58 family)